MKLREKLTYANVVSSIALFMVVAGGSAYAASHLIKGSQIAKGTITAANIKKGSLLKTNFKTGQLPAGPIGPAGPAGAAGAAGPAGTAHAYGIVATNATTLNATFTLNVGFPGAIRNPAAGVYCITAPAGAAGEPLALNLQGAVIGFISQTSANQCNTGEYQIETADTGGTLTNIPFTVIVP
jgi:hypothetical protein